MAYPRPSCHRVPSGGNLVGREEDKRYDRCPRSNGRAPERIPKKEFDMDEKDDSAIRWVLAGAGKEPTGWVKDHVRNLIPMFPKPKPPEPKK